MIRNPKIELAKEFVSHTGKSIFLTGKAGTGKTTFLKSLRDTLPKRMIVVAPTGVAAINAGGVTIHSFFQMPFGPIVPGMAKQRENNDYQKFKRNLNREKVAIIKSLDLLIIDEISMVRADLLDGVDEVLRKYRGNQLPFGGVQLLMIGDLEQLSPVVKNDEKSILSKYYDTPYFFSSNALKKTQYVSIVLDHVYRQEDQRFLDILNKVREKTLDENSLMELNKRYLPGFIDKAPEGYIILTTHNAQARNINQSRLEKIDAPGVFFKGEVEGDFPEYIYPTDLDLELKVGTQVMFIKNDTNEKLYFNGKIGIIADIDDEDIWVQCENEDDAIPVHKERWENVKYSIDKESKEIKEEITGTFVQYPLKLAWAITIHKSQGLTFEKAIIDARAAFAHGQVYVALSRCKTLEGMVLNSTISPHILIKDHTVSGFTAQADSSQPGQEDLSKAKREYEKEMLFELFRMDKLKNHYNSLLIRVKKNISSLGINPMADMESIQKEIITDLAEVQKRFFRQLNTMIVDNPEISGNQAMQSRIQKAAGYFYQKIEKNLTPKIKALPLVSENKEVKKLLKHSLESLYRELHVRTKCLEVCTTGFKLEKFIHTRALSEIENLEKVKIPDDALSVDTSKEVKNPKVYANLIKWRNKVAEEEQLPKYMVIQVKTAANVSNLMPGSLDELGKIKGIGKKTIEKYGETILDIISGKKEISKESGTSKLPATVIKTYDLFCKGLPPEKIASTRELVLSTIIGHLTKCVEEGFIDSEKLIDKDKLEKIFAYFEESDDQGLKNAKEFFGDEVSYDELRIGMVGFRKSGHL